MLGIAPSWEEEWQNNAAIVQQGAALGRAGMTVTQHYSQVSKERSKGVHGPWGAKGGGFFTLFKNKKGDTDSLICWPNLQVLLSSTQRV